MGVEERVVHREHVEVVQLHDHQGVLVVDPRPPPDSRSVSRVCVPVGDGDECLQVGPTDE